jgi:hypothetical protein
VIFGLQTNHLATLVLRGCKKSAGKKRGAKRVFVEARKNFWQTPFHAREKTTTTCDQFFA